MPRINALTPEDVPSLDDLVPLFDVATDTTKRTSLALALELAPDAHTHVNKSLLDTYTQTEVNLADTVAKKHTHANMAALDLISGINTGDQDLSGYMTVGAWQTWSPTITGFSANPTGGIYRYRTIGGETEIEIRQPNDGTSNATTFTISLPVAAATITDMVWQETCRVKNNGTFVAAPGYASITSGGTVIDLFINTGTTAWGAASGKRVDYLRMKYVSV